MGGADAMVTTRVVMRSATGTVCKAADAAVADVCWVTAI
jgi:hypothetical protein